ncbi:MAG: alpha/beta fold hydrolase [Candidatus Micrarchaeota archaeon]
MDAILVHGAYGNPEENWFPWLKRELEKLGFNVFVPEFPTPGNQNLENWLRVFEEYRRHLGPDTILVGHSLGPAFILHVLEKFDRPIWGAFFVAGFISEIGNPDFDGINRTFYQRTDFSKVKENCRSFFVFYSDNDPYVREEKSMELATSLDVKPMAIKDAGHFNGKNISRFTGKNKAVNRIFSRRRIGTTHSL